MFKPVAVPCHPWPPGTKVVNIEGLKGIIKTPVKDVNGVVVGYYTDFQYGWLKVKYLAYLGPPDCAEYKLKLLLVNKD